MRFPEFVGEWVEKRLGKIAIKVGSGKTPKGGDKVYTNEGIPFIRSQNVINNSLLLNYTHISLEVHKSMNGSKVLPNDILLNITGGSIGRSCVVPNDFIEGNVNQHVSIIRLKNDNSIFLQSILNSWRGQKLVFQGMTGSGREGLNFESIKNFRIYFPFVNEQTKIATFLTTIEGRIDTQSKIIEDYESLKKGMMQQIFSQKLRFKDENGNYFPEWEDKKLGEIGSFYYGKSAPKHSLSEKASTPCVRYGELYTKFNGVIDKIYSYTEIPDKNLKFSNGGEILIPRVGEEPLDFSKCSLLKLKGVAIGEMISVYNTKQHQSFIVAYIRAKLRNVFARVVEGGNVSNLYFRYLENIAINLPAILEQQKIANFLSSIDKKIEKEKQILAQYQQQKKYLLQNLFI